MELPSDKNVLRNLEQSEDQMTQDTSSNTISPNFITEKSFVLQGSWMLAKGVGAIY